MKVDAASSLDKFLANKNVRMEEVLGEIRAYYGEPQLIVATGSVIAGFGTPVSDIDFIVVVENENVTELPIMAFRNEVRIDVEYYSSKDLLQQWNHIFCLSQDLDIMTLRSKLGWADSHRIMRTLSRLEHGHIISASKFWESKLSALKTQKFYDALADWWRSEALRYRIGSDWLAARKPLLALIRMQDSVLAELSATCALGGQTIMSKKWLPAKLRSLNSEAGLQIFRDTLSINLDVTDDLKFKQIKKLKDYYGQWNPSSKCKVCVRLSEGVKLFNLRHEWVFSRWLIRANTFSPSDEINVKNNQVASTILWEGPIEKYPDPIICDLFTADYVELDFMSEQ